MPDLGLALAVFVAGLVLRLVYLGQAWSIPFLEHPIVDSAAYDAWALRIAGGDLLGDRVFYQAPAYPYLLASVYRIFGHDLWIAHVVQMVGGALGCALVFVATRLFFGRSAAIFAGALVVLYTPAIFFDGLLQKTGLAALLLCALVALLALFQRRPHAAVGAGLGLLLGLLCLTRENALVLAPLVPVWMLVRFRAHGRAASAIWAAAFLGGLAFVLVSVGLRNQIVGGTFAVTTSQAGPNFYIGNNPQATGYYVPLLPGRHTPDFEGSDARLLAEKALGRELDAGEVSRYWLDRSFAFIRESPGAWLELLLAKILLAVNAVEIPDTEGIELYAEASPLLRALGWLDFRLLFPLALAGMVLAWERRADAAILYVLAAALAGSVVLFYVMARYRFVVVPVLLPFAGLALAETLRRLRARQLRGLLGASLAFATGIALASLPLVDEQAFRVTGYVNLGNVMMNQERDAEAALYLERAARIQPELPDVQLHLAVLYTRQGRLEDAEQLLRQLLLQADYDYRAHRALGIVLRRQGRRGEAARHLRRARQLEPERGDAAEAVLGERP